MSKVSEKFIAEQEQAQTNIHDYSELEYMYECDKLKIAIASKEQAIEASDKRTQASIENSMAILNRMSQRIDDFLNGQFKL